jgi:hypothetical protein
MKAKVSVASLLACLLLLLTAVGVLYKVSGGDIIAGWPGVAVENWKEYGLRALKGQLVVNPGGFEATTKPVVYTGHRPLSLYPVLAVEKLFAWAGTSMLPFHLVFSLALLLSVWALLGRGSVAWLAAMAALFSPGYTLYPGHCDPNAMALYALLPLAAWLLPTLAQPSISPLKTVLMGLLLLAYTSLNWTTVFGHGMLVGYLLVSRSIPRRRLALYIGLAAVAVVVVTGVSVLDKLGEGRRTGAGLEQLLAFYLWGPAAYGGMTTDKAFLRIGTASAFGMFPLVLVCMYLSIKRWQWNRTNSQADGLGTIAAESAHSQPRLWVVLLPLIVAATGIAVMRNYFGNHPWMAAPMLMPGLVLSLRLLLDAGAAESARKAVEEKPAAQIGFAGVCLGYALVVVFMHRAYHTGTMDLVAMVRDHTTRSETVVVVRSLDPKLAEAKGDLADAVDRRVVVVDSLMNLPEAPEKSVMVSETETGGKLPTLAKTASPAVFCAPALEELFGLYAKGIARRNPNALRFMFQSGTVFYLYPCRSEATYAKGH